MDPAEIREKIGRFRILVIGRANAGKTTILQRVCNTRDNPEIYDSAGNKIDLTVIMASRERGLHDIENEMVFKSNPGFIFHDSRGFEAGGASEFEKVKEFIASRSKEQKMTNQLHAIWYCIPMDEASRSFTAGENKFFSQCDTGSIPVIVLFTKFDALYDVEYAKLKKEGRSRKDAREMAPKRAEESFPNGPQLKFLKDVRWPPKCYVCLSNMEKDDGDCKTLIERTAGALDNEVLQQLFVSTQQTNLETCMKYAVERILSEHFNYAETTTAEDYERIIGTLGSWFPHIWAYTYLTDELHNELDIDVFSKEPLRDYECVEMRSRLLSAASHSSPLENIVQLISAGVIIFEHSFYIFDKRRYIQDKESGPSFHVALEQYMASPHAATMSGPSFHVALEQYMASPHAATMREAASAAVQAYGEAVATATHAYEETVRTAVYPYQGKLPSWITKLPFGSFKRKTKEAKESFERSQAEEKESLCSRAKMELIEVVLEIALNHRLARP